MMGGGTASDGPPSSQHPPIETEGTKMDRDTTRLVEMSPIDRLRSVLGDEHVITDPEQREFFSRDLSWLPHETAAVVVQPGTVEELAGAVRAATDAGYAVVPRGGGMSYTKGYVPERPGSVMVDMRRLDRIVEINAEDMYVTVECGCTWKKLYEALQEEGVRTPYFGPLSGMYATVGGALSQNSLFLGSGVYNTVAESCLGLEVVLADGSIVQTGSGAHRNGAPFYRHFGPDLTGIFTADTGAFGIKARATLRLIQTPPVTAFASFAFETLDQMLEAQIELARMRIASECYGFDPCYNAAFEKLGFTFKEELTTLGKVALSGGSFLSGVKGAFRLALKGKRLLRNVKYSLHMTLDALDEATANSALAAARRVCAHEGEGVELESSLPRVMRAQPFESVRSVLLGSEGEIWLPIHCFLPLSKARAAAEATEEFFRDNADAMKEHGIKVSYLTCFSGTEFVIEPSLYWFDELGPFRLNLIEPEFREKWKSHAPNPAAREVALRLRDGLRQIYLEMGACHLQIGKYYPYREAMGNEHTWSLIEGIKDILDPRRLINPGSLGLR